MTVDNAEEAAGTASIPSRSGLHKPSPHVRTLDGLYRTTNADCERWLFRGWNKCVNTTTSCFRLFLSLLFVHVALCRVSGIQGARTEGRLDRSPGTFGCSTDSLVRESRPRCGLWLVQMGSPWWNWVVAHHFRKVECMDGRFLVHYMKQALTPWAAVPFDVVLLWRGLQLLTCTRPEQMIALRWTKVLEVNLPSQKPVSLNQAKNSRITTKSIAVFQSAILVKLVRINIVENYPCERKLVGWISRDLHRYELPPLLDIAFQRRDSKRSHLK